MTMKRGNIHYVQISYAFHVLTAQPTVIVFAYQKRRGFLYVLLIDYQADPILLSDGCTLQIFGNNMLVILPGQSRTSFSVRSREYSGTCFSHV